MRLLKLAAALAVALPLAACLSGCGTTGAKVLDNVSADCARKYDGTISAGITGGQFTGTVKIDCQPRGTVTAGAVVAPAAAAPPS